MVLGCASHRGTCAGFAAGVVPANLQFILTATLRRGGAERIATGQIVNHPTTRKLYFCTILVSHIYSNQGMTPKPKPAGQEQVTLASRGRLSEVMEGLILLCL